ncbi:RNA polymerase sigma factor [Rossellomorea vietnamensis]|uniref:RNA polymerase sigma factor n=1 Tax=Rossellomorea vietnamensis TaxID=218284 RepID=UPI003CF12C20
MNRPNIETLYRKHHQEVYKFLICFTGCKNEAEDLTQEVFLKLIKSSSNYNGSCTITTWIFSIAKHTAIDHYRKKKFYSIVKDSFFKNMTSLNSDPQHLIIHDENKHLIHQAILQLKPSYRAVIILRGINEFTISETAEILNCSISKVKVTYHRALKRMKDDIELSGLKEVLKNA